MWKKYRKFILPAILLIAIVVFVFVKFYVFKESATSVGSQKAEVEIKASDLLSEFEKDENASNTKYLNKVILVKGTVDNVNETSSNYTVYIKEKGNTSGVMCSFDKKEYQNNPIKSGDAANVKGICNGYLMDVVLNKCTVQK